MSRRIYYKFEAEGAAYHSFAFSRQFLIDNGVPAHNIVSIDIGREAFPSERKFDLVVSLLSWGFHYPIDTYLDQVHGVLTDEGCMIVDARNNTGGMKKIGDKFVEVSVIEQTPKFSKIAARTTAGGQGK